MDYKSLLHVIAVASEGSFVLAAEKVSLSQSAVSRSILSIERELDVVLFDRTPAGVKLTTAGKVFLEHARKIVADTLALKHRMQQTKLDISGHIAFGSVPTLAISRVTQLLSHCIADLPKLTINVKVDINEALCLELHRENIEFFVSVKGLSSNEPGLEQQIIGQIPGGAIYCREHHPLTKKTNITHGDLSLFPNIMSGLGEPLSESYRNLTNIHNNDPLRAKLVCNDLFVLHQIVNNTDALLFASQGLTTELISAEPALVELPLARPAAIEKRADVVIVTSKGRSLSPTTRYLIEQLQQLLTAQPDTRRHSTDRVKNFD